MMLKKTTIVHASKFREIVARKLGIPTEGSEASIALCEKSGLFITSAVSIQESEREVAETKLFWQQSRGA